MKLINRMCDILEYSSQDKEYDFPIKGHNLNDDDVIVFINSELYGDGENLEVKKIIKKEEGAYSCNRFFDGLDAKDEGFSYYVNFYRNYKKGLGKYTNYKVTLERFNDE